MAINPTHSRASGTDPHSAEAREEEAKAEAKAEARAAARAEAAALTQNIRNSKMSFDQLNVLGLRLFEINPDTRTSVITSAVAQLLALPPPLALNTSDLIAIRFCTTQADIDSLPLLRHVASAIKNVEIPYTFISPFHRLANREEVLTFFLDNGQKIDPTYCGDDEMSGISQNLQRRLKENFSSPAQ